MKNVLIVGEFYSENLGDGILCEVVTKYFKQQCDIRCFDLSGRDSYNDKKADEEFHYLKEEFKYLKTIVKKIIYKFGYTKNGKNLKSIVTRTIEKFDFLVKAYKPDYILFAGGQMFLDSFLNQIKYICEYAEEKDIPVIFNACGLGKVNELNKKKIQKILNMNCIKYISVRDGIEEIKQLTDKNIYDTYDTAILANEYYSLEENKTNPLGVGIMLTYKQPVWKQIVFWKKILEELLKKDINFKIFTNGSMSDYIFAKYLIKKLHRDDKKYLLSRPKMPEELVKEINSFESILSMRLHSLIIAYSLSIPAISISWDKKVQTFYKKINRSDLCFNLFDNTTKIIETLEAKKNKIYDNNKKEEIKSNIKRNLNNIQHLIVE